MTYTFGADPELFLFNTKTQKFVSAHGIIPGTKEEPFKVENGAVQLDGTAAEFNIDPVDNFKDFHKNIRSVVAQLNDMVKKHDKNLKLVATPTATFDQEYFDKVIPDTSKELGCQPDFCAKSGNANPCPDPGNRPFRTGGGHVHIGWTKDMKLDDPNHFLDCRILAMNLYNCGLKNDYLWDGDNERRTLYGSKYSFRPKPFGMEYRYLSNAWVMNTDAMRYIFNICKKTVEDLDARFTKPYEYHARHVALPKRIRTAYEKANPRPYLPEVTPINAKLGIINNANF